MQMSNNTLEVEYPSLSRRGYSIRKRWIPDKNLGNDGKKSFSTPCFSRARRYGNVASMISRLRHRAPFLPRAAVPPVFLFILLIGLLAPLASPVHASLPPGLSGNELTQITDTLDASNRLRTNSMFLKNISS